MSNKDHNLEEKGFPKGKIHFAEYILDKVSVLRLVLNSRFESIGKIEVV